MVRVAGWLAVAALLLAFPGTAGFGAEPLLGPAPGPAIEPSPETIPPATWTVPAPRACSSAPGTRIVLWDKSTIAIEDVQVGHWVWASDPVTGEAGPRKVLHTIMGEGPKDLVVLTIDGATVTATAGHPFWVEGPDVWMDAGDLQVGHQVLSSDGGLLTIEAIVEHQAVARVHNVEVEGLHTYYVQFGDEEVLVHNSTCGLQRTGLASEGGVELLEGGGRRVLRTPTGEVFDVPVGWKVGLTRHADGLYAKLPGSPNNVNTIRVMDTGYLRYSDSTGQAINPRTGGYGVNNKDSLTHVAWDYDGPLIGWPK